MEELKRQASRDNTNIPRLLISDAGLKPDEIGYSLEQFYQVPFHPYDQDVSPALDLVRHISEDYLRHQFWVPLSGSAEESIILIDDPTDTQRIQEIYKCIPAERYVFRVGLPDDIQRYLGHEIGARDETNIEDLVVRLEEVGGEDTTDQTEDVLSENTAVVIQLVNKLILEAHRLNASDIQRAARHAARPDTRAAWASTNCWRAARKSGA